MSGKHVHSKNVNIENVVNSGFYIKIDSSTIFVPFDKFGIFRDVAISDLFDVEYCSDNSLHWENADIDIDIDVFLHPQNYKQRFPAYPKRKALAKELVKIANELNKLM